MHGFNIQSQFSSITVVVRGLGRALLSVRSYRPYRERARCPLRGKRRSSLSASAQWRSPSLPRLMSTRSGPVALVSSARTRAAMDPTTLEIDALSPAAPACGVLHDISQRNPKCPQHQEPCAIASLPDELIVLIAKTLDAPCLASFAAASAFCLAGSAWRVACGTCGTACGCAALPDALCNLRRWRSLPALPPPGRPG